MVGVWRRGGRPSGVVREWRRGTGRGSWWSDQRDLVLVFKAKRLFSWCVLLVLPPSPTLVPLQPSTSRRCCHTLGNVTEIFTSCELHCTYIAVKRSIRETCSPQHGGLSGPGLSRHHSDCCGKKQKCILFCSLVVTFRQV